MKKINKLIFVLCFVPCISMAGSKFCFDREVSIYCEAELDQNYSLNGYFVKEGRHYDFFARRAFDGDWCHKTLKSIMRAMKSGPFCMGFEESSMITDLTIDWVKSNSREWSYFNK